jgi:dihydroorotase
VFDGDRLRRADVAILDGRIAAVEPGITRPAREIVDAQGKIVTPGLVDLHTHVHPGATHWGIAPDPIAWCSGVTTWVDAGSAGAYTIGSLLAARHRVRVVPLLNISAVGLTAAAGESRDLANCDPDLAAETLRRNPSIKGIKVRMDRHNVGANGVEPLRRAVLAAGAKPLMVHIGAPPPALGDILEMLRPGDIVTHCASGHAAARGGLDPAARAAYQNGVFFDIGHGMGSFAFDVAQAQLDAGMPPHTISTDLHQHCLHGPAFDLPTTMAKLLAIGMGLPEVLAAVTATPARALGLDAGTLRAGAAADVAVFRIEEGRFPLTDVEGRVRTGRVRLRNELTLLAGTALPPQLPEPPEPWVRLTAAQREALTRREAVVRDLLTAPPVGAEGLEEQLRRDQPT